MKIKANSRGGVPVWSLSDRLSKSLEYGEVSKLEMADYLGVSANTVGNYLAGRTKISRGFLVLWAQRDRRRPGLAGNRHSSVRRDHRPRCPITKSL
jgi:transcriptional regulator with XRE-family HTH domain